MADTKSKHHIPTRVLSGFAEYDPAIQLEFEAYKARIEEVYRVYGFTPIGTPIIERTEVLFAKTGGETQKQIYRFERGDNDLSLRFDLTVPLARYVSEHYSALTFPFRVSHVGKVFRAERPQKGRFRELYQCDVDILEEDSRDISHDAEVIATAYAALIKLDIGQVKLKLNNRKVLSGFLEGLAEGLDPVEVLRSIDKLEKIGSQGVSSELQGLGLTDGDVERLLSFVNLSGENFELISKLKEIGADTETFKQGVSELEDLLKLLLALGVPETDFQIEPSIARGLDYYTGTIFETYLEEARDFGSICSGGRYDNLVAAFSSREISGVGASIGLTRVFDYLHKSALLNLERHSPAEALILPMTEDHSEAFKLAAELRAAGISVHTLSGNKKFKAKMKYADRLGVPYVLILGEDEISSGEVSLKCMKTGVQKSLRRADIASAVKGQSISGRVP